MYLPVHFSYEELVSNMWLSMFSPAAPSMISSPGIVKIVVRQTAGKDGGPVPTLAVAPSPRVVPQVSPSPHAYLNTTPVRNAAPIHIVQRTPGPATAHYTIAPPGKSNPTQSQSQPPRPILKVVQPPSNTEQSGKKGTCLDLLCTSHSAVLKRSCSSLTYSVIHLPNDSFF